MGSGDEWWQESSHHASCEVQRRFRYQHVVARLMVREAVMLLEMSYEQAHWMGVDLTCAGGIEAEKIEVHTVRQSHLYSESAY